MQWQACLIYNRNKNFQNDYNPTQLFIISYSHKIVFILYYIIWTVGIAADFVVVVVVVAVVFE